LTKDYEVYQPGNEHLAQLVVGVLEGRGYDAGYQIGYPKIKVFIRVEAKEEADKISRLIKKFMAKYAFGETGIPSAKLNLLISKLATLIPSKTSEKIKTEEIEQISREKIEYKLPEALVADSSLKVKLEELKSEITERIKFLEAQMAKNPKDRLNNDRTIERDTLNWVLRIMP
jgi:hypothetical protein